MRGQRPAVLPQGAGLLVASSTPVLKVSPFLSRKSRQEGGCVIKCRRPVQRRMTCPSPQEISRALQSPPAHSSFRSASLDELILRCLHCFDSDGKLIRGTQLVHMTLMMHNWVVSSHIFAQKLLSLYKDCPAEKRGQRRPQICHFIRQWINQFRIMFEVDPLLEEGMGDLWALVRVEGSDSHCQLFNTPYINPPVNVSQTPSPSVKKRKVSLLFDHMEPDEMAEHLSYLEFKNFCNVSFLDYRSYVVHGSVRDNPALERSVMLCNGVSQWVQLMILNKHTSQQRAEVFTKFIHVAQFLDYRSYVVHGSVRDNPALERSVMLCNGVSQWVQLMILNKHTSQQRAEVFTKFIHVAQTLTKNFCNVSFLDYRSYVVHGSVRDNPALERSVMLCNGVSQWVQLMILNKHTSQQRAEVFTKFIHVAQTLSELTELLSSYSNYSNYRRLYNECTGFKVPILGVHLKDLISLNEALPDYLEDDKINLGKLQHLYSNISDLLAIHECTPPFEANKDLLHLLTLSLDLCYTEDEIYELSYTKEPKNPKIQPVAPVKPPVVAEWGSGVTPRLDPATISKHVKQMVDSIMKNYDLNMDGYISLEDFEKIAANFPFSFCTHESEREGEISRAEITSYFMRGMSVCAKLGFNLHNLHNFHETTYKRPTFCDTCGGFLWGVIKQGYHCKDCGVNCHKHCKDVVGMECIKRFQVTSSSCPCTPGPVSGLHTKGNSWSSEEEAFVFPNGNGSEHTKGQTSSDSDAEAATLSDRSTQTDPVDWTPVAKQKDRLPSQKQHPPLEKSATLPARVRGSSAPSSLLQEKMDELKLNKDKRKEPD
ncbi:RAS guanyl-releasing protein 1 [Sinocyclocheilus grahami]|uniref:RAS guanyl-releasing protein 1 n=1 Tax=Sinocyclocheilus grahami TaxID=75366 RepID=UPI0007AC93FD|nr:PREDICTED: RAS guanyl-releasing protein 1 [Sinocyclocheilus grahami]